LSKALVIDGKTKQAVKIITDILTTANAINIDHSDIEAIFSQPEPVLLSTGIGVGKNRVLEACKYALSNSWKKAKMKRVTRIIVRIHGPMDLSLGEVNEALNIIKETVSKDAKIVFGVARDAKLNTQVEVTLLAVVNA
jgi:cell division GTPase FtsZ